jgi:hypothetical protein
MASIVKVFHVHSIHELAMIKSPCGQRRCQQNLIGDEGSLCHCIRSRIHGYHIIGSALLPICWHYKIYQLKSWVKNLTYK